VYGGLLRRTRNDTVQVREHSDRGDHRRNFCTRAGKQWPCVQSEQQIQSAEIFITFLVFI